MFKLNNFEANKQSSCEGEQSLFIKLLKLKWDEIHNKPNVFRYKITNLLEKLVDGKYLLQLNPDRSTNRRTPEHINSICQPFDESKFNFTKVSMDEVLFTLDHNGDEHSVLVNVSPISRYHSLLCPSVNKKLPQVVTADSLSLTLEIMFTAEDWDLKIGFNSLCALASVNHLHYHLFLEKHTLPVELMKWKHLNGILHCTEDYPIQAFCFQVQRITLQKDASEIHKVIEYFVENSIAHNIFITRKLENVAVVLYPRKGSAGVKQLADFNVALCELSGWFPVFSEKAFETLKSEDLENELKKWSLDNFEKLCDEVKLLFK